LHTIANEPSVGLYRIQKNVHKMLPQVADSHKKMRDQTKKIDDQVYDLATAIEVVKDVASTKDTFSNIEQILQKATASAALLSMTKPRN